MAAMSTDDKQKMSATVMWLFRAATAVGAFFMVQTYNGIVRTNDLLQDIRREQAVNDTYYRMKLDEHDRAIQRHDRWIDHQDTKDSKR
jgi:hypothetical protein